jgi:hypothetical protein
MLKQVSPSFTVYSKGVGLGSGVKVAVGGSGVKVRVGVSVGVIDGVVVGSIAGAEVLLINRKTSAELTMTNNANNPMAAGKPKVISGIRLPWTTLDCREGFKLT